ncbi:hypothetical protein [Streptomyces sp. NPDC006691]|uniref:hypothetical protein n=1 Tax=Streptomyces sp. NPDC006691 TaxID=3364757 RepID=UPI0036B6F4FB
MKQWDYVVYEREGRTGLITLDLGDDLMRVAFLRPPPWGRLREATIRTGDLRPASAQQTEAARAAGLTPESQRSFLPGRGCGDRPADPDSGRVSPTAGTAPGST